jgi:hypothetical protein
MDKNANISEEEKKNIHDALDGVLKQYSLSNEISQEYEKLLECRHEIVITLTAKVLEQDDTGDTTGVKEICKQNYHIPVPQNKNYHEYMAGFFDRLQKCIMVSDQSATESASEVSNG